MKKLVSIVIPTAMILTLGSAAVVTPAAAAGPSALSRFKDPDHTARPMARMWFPDATAGQDPNDTIEEQILGLAEAGFGGVEVAMLSDTGTYDNDETRIAGWGTPNWNKLLKKIYKAAAKVPDGFVVDLTISAHWPPTINTIDPNDATASKETSISFTALDPDELAAGSAALELPATKSADHNKAPFLFTDTLISASLAKVTKVTHKAASGNTAAYNTYEVDYDTMQVLGATQGEGSVAGIPDKAFYDQNKATYGWTGSYSDAVVSAFGPDPSGSGPAKIDDDGNRRRLADTQYAYSVDLSEVGQEVSDAVAADPDPETVEAGDYVLVSVFYRGTGQNFSGGRAMLMRNRPYVPDYFDRAGIRTVTDYWNENIFSDSELSRLIAANPGSIFEDSIEASVSTNFWTPKLLSRLEKSYPYLDQLPFVVSGVRVPGGFGSTVGPDVLDFTSSDPALVDRIYEDYNTLMGQLYLDEHITPANEWAASHGLTFRAQTYDLAGMDIGAAASLVTIPEGDNMTKGDGLRRLSGANNLNDKKYLSMEAITGTAVNRFNWEEVLFELTSNYSWGVNRAILHGTPYSKALNGGVFTGGFGGGKNSADWPGWDAFGAGSFGESYTYRQIYWDAQRQVTDYLSRIQALMQYSTQKIDVVVLHDQHEAFENPSGNSFQALLDAGYSYNLLSDGMLTSPKAAKISKKTIYPDGPAYKAVILDEAQTLSIRTINLLSAYADAGIPIILLDTDPATATVYGTDRGQDATLQAKYQKLAAKPAVKKASSKSELPAILAAAGVHGYARYSVPRLETTAYVDGANTYYYVYNNTSTFQGMLAAGSVKGYKDADSATYAPSIESPTVTLQGAGTPYILDAFTGEIRQAGEYTVNSDGTVTVRLDTLKGGEATIVALASAALAPTGPAVTSVTGGRDYTVSRDPQGTPVLHALKSGSYQATLGTGTKVKVDASVPATMELKSWKLKLDSYGPKYDDASQLLDKNGIQLVDPSATRITSVDLGSVSLGAWKDLSVSSGVLNSLGVTTMDEVSGRGYYTTQFDWSRPDAGAVLHLGYGNDQITAVTINGSELALNNLTDTVDLGSHLRVGSNTLTVELSSTLNHRAAAVKGGSAYGGGIFGNVPDKYLVNGLQTASLVPYVRAALTEPAPVTPVDTSIVVPAIEQVYGKTAKVTVSVSPAATGTVTLEAGSRTVTAALSGGRATLTIPAKALEPGKRTVVVSYAGVPGSFNPSRATATVTVAKATATVKAKPSKSKVKRGKTATFSVVVTASGVTPTGKVTVKVAGKSRTVKLSKTGKATVRIVLPKSAKTGKKTVTVSYGGDARVASAKATSKLTIVR